jgi:thiol-disulfide isomerase/thioredoxin
MKPISAIVILLLGFAAAFGQGEKAPIVEKQIAYNDWTLKNLNGGGETNLRQFAAGKKLVMVAYWAPWCLNWRNDVAFVQGLHEKYGDKGLSIIGVGEYDTVSRMRQHVEQYKLTFPIVYETESSSARENSMHFTLRKAVGDMRRWGTPWYVFIEPANVEPKTDVLMNKAEMVIGELIHDEAEAFIREKLGLEKPNAVRAGKPDLEVCVPESRSTALVKP